MRDWPVGTSGGRAVRATPAMGGPKREPLPRPAPHPQTTTPWVTCGTREEN